MAEKFSSVPAYLDSLPERTRAVLEEVAATIHEAVPGGQDVISYNIPAVSVDGKPLLYYAGYAAHVSVYPVPDADGQLAAALEPHLAGKGTLRFALDEPVPLDLVRRVAERFLELRRGG